MPVPFKIRLTRQSDGVEEICQGQISGKDWQLFRTFRDFAMELRATEWVRSGLDSHYTAGSDESGFLKVEAPNRAPDSAVRELLHVIRPFVLKGEPTWYPAVNSRLRRYLDHPHLRALLATSRRVFDNGHFHLYGQISINDLPLHDEHTFSLWLNAFEYHRDQEKQAILAAAFNGPPDELALAVFRSILADRAAESCGWPTSLRKSTGSLESIDSKCRFGPVI